MVRAKLDALRRDRTDGRLIVTDGAAMTVGELLDKLLADKVEVNSAGNTYRCYSNCVENHSKPVIGLVKLDKLTAYHVDEMLARMARNGTGDRMRQLTWFVLRRALSQGVKWKLLAVNPTDGVQRPKVARREHKVLTAEQIGKLLTEAKKNRLYACWYLAAVSGMRRSELAGLKWGDVDFEAGFLTIKRQVAYANGSGQPLVKEAKITRSHRMVDLPVEAIDVLKEHRAQSMPEGFAALPWVFVSKVGTFVNPVTLWNVHERTLKRAGVPHVRMHDLRHSHATLLLLAGVNSKIIQERLGHSQISVTMDTYSHVLPSMQREAADKIGELIKAPA